MREAKEKELQSRRKTKAEEFEETIEAAKTQRRAIEDEINRIRTNKSQDSLQQRDNTSMSPRMSAHNFVVDQMISPPELATDSIDHEGLINRDIAID